MIPVVVICVMTICCGVQIFDSSMIPVVVFRVVTTYCGLQIFHSSMIPVVVFLCCDNMLWSTNSSTSKNIVVQSSGLKRH